MLQFNCEMMDKLQETERRTALISRGAKLDEKERLSAAVPRCENGEIGEIMSVINSMTDEAYAKVLKLCIREQNELWSYLSSTLKTRPSCDSREHGDTRTHFPQWDGDKDEWNKLSKSNAINHVEESFKKPRLPEEQVTANKPNTFNNRSASFLAPLIRSSNLQYRLAQPSSSDRSVLQLNRKVCLSNRDSIKNVGLTSRSQHCSAPPGHSRSLQMPRTLCLRRDYSTLHSEWKIAPGKSKSLFPCRILSEKAKAISTVAETLSVKSRDQIASVVNKMECLECAEKPNEVARVTKCPPRKLSDCTKKCEVHHLPIISIRSECKIQKIPPVVLKPSVQSDEHPANVKVFEFIYGEQTIKEHHPQIFSEPNQFQEKQMAPFENLPTATIPAMRDRETQTEPVAKTHVLIQTETFSSAKPKEMHDRAVSCELLPKCALSHFAGNFLRRRSALAQASFFQRAVLETNPKFSRTLRSLNLKQEYSSNRSRKGLSDSTVQEAATKFLIGVNRHLKQVEDRISHRNYTSGDLSSWEEDTRSSVRRNLAVCDFATSSGDSIRLSSTTQSGTINCTNTWTESSIEDTIAVMRKCNLSKSEYHSTKLGPSDYEVPISGDIF